MQQAWLDSRGLVGDRRWMLINANGRMVTQRQAPKLALVQVRELEFEQASHQALPEDLIPGLLPLRVNAPGMSELTITPLDEQAKGLRYREVGIWQDRCQAWLADNTCHQWFSDYLNQPIWLVQQHSTMLRPIDPDYADLTPSGAPQQVAFSDGFPLLLISQASLDDLNHKLASKTQPVAPIAMAAFRPNLVLSGCDAYAEDQAKQLVVMGEQGEQSFDLVKPCARCVIPSINLATGQFEDEPTRTLKTYRRDATNQQIYFGQNLLLGQDLLNAVQQHPQQISVGTRARLI